MNIMTLTASVTAATVLSAIVLCTYESPIEVAIKALPASVVVRCHAAAPQLQAEAAEEIEAKIKNGELRGKFAGFARMYNTVESVEMACRRQEAISRNPSLRPM
jgi:hypothetical protein